MSKFWRLVAMGAGVFLLLFLLGRVALAASGGGYLITMTGMWIGIVVTVFVLFSGISTIVVVRTFNASKIGWPKFKTFWNGVEVAWVMAAGLGLFTAVSTATPMMQAFAASEYRREKAASEASVLTAAQAVEARHCHGMQGPPVCPTIRDIAAAHRLADVPTWAWEVLRQPSNRARDTVLGKEIGDLRRLYLEYSEFDMFIASEPRTRTLPDWTGILLIFAPLVFAAIFPLRLGRAVVSFASEPRDT